jgi:hypothetical protein
MNSFQLRSVINILKLSGRPGERWCLNGFRQGAIAIFLLTVFSACGFKSPPPPDLSASAALPEKDAHELLEELRHIALEIQSLRARLDVNLSNNLGDVALSQVVAFKRPDNLRLEFFATKLNTLTSILITRRGALHAVDPIHMKVYRGTSDAASIGRLLSIPFAPEEMMLWLTGRVLVPETEMLASIEAYSRDDQRSLVVKLPDSREMVAVFEKSGPHSQLRLMRFELRSKEGIRLLISDFSYATASSEAAASSEVDAVFPEEIQFWVPDEKLHGVLRYERHELNPDFGPHLEKVFLGHTPSGAKVYYLDDVSVLREVEPLF